MKDMIDGIEQAYDIYEKNAFEMPVRSQVQDDQNTLVLMPCLTDDYITTKLITVFPENKDIPTIHGLVVLNCNHTGKVKALIDGTYLTGARTGAIGGSAIRRLAKKDVTKLAVIGAGVQGLYQTIAACEERDFKEVFVYNRTKGDKINEFVQNLKQELHNDIKVCAVDTVEEAVKEAEVIITATNSYEPVLPNDQELFKGKLIVGVGSFQPTMREFPEALYKEASRIYIDTKDAIEESGDLATPLENKWIENDDIQTLSSFISNDETVNDDETIIFKSTGMALFDAVTASVIYEKAKNKKTGIDLD